MFGFFYYSASQKKARSQKRDNRLVFCKSILGKESEYTEMVSRFPFKPAGTWKDYKLVCIGFFSRSTEE